MKKLWIKIRVRLDLWHDAIEHWFDTHVRVVSKKAVRQLVQERDLLRESMEELEDQSSTDIEKLTQENDYLKDELAYEHIKNKRLEEEMQTVRDREYKDIYPGLQAENKDLQEKLDTSLEKQFKMGQMYIDLCNEQAFKQCEACTGENIEDCPFEKVKQKYFGDEDEVPTETSPEDS